MSILSVVTLHGCQVLDVVDDNAPAEAESPIAVTTLPVDPAYPKLRTVPPRPQLSYSVEQRREIVESLIGDREHARYTRRRIRYRTGLSSLPPPPSPEPDDATATARAVIGDQPEAPAPPAPRADVPAAGYGDISDPAATDDGDLGDFMRGMVRESEPTPAATTEPAPDEAEPPEPDGSSSLETTPAMSAAPASHSSGASPSGDPSARRLFAWLDRIKRDVEPAGAAAAVPPSAKRASKARDASPPVGAVPVAAAAVRRQDGEEGKAARDVEVTAVSTPAAMTPDMHRKNARASREAAGAPSPAPPTAAGVVARPKLKPSHVRPAPEAKPEAGTVDRAPVATLTFADGSAKLPADATSRLQEALASLKGHGMIRIVGQGEVMALALDRARAVALGLMRLGAGAGDLEIAAETVPADQVRIVLGGRRPRS